MGLGLRMIATCLRHPARAVAVFLALSACWIPALFRLHLETDGRDLFPPDHPALRFQDEVEARYATGDFVVVAVSAEGERDLFASAALNLMLSLSERLAALPGVLGAEVRSLATEFAPEWVDGALRLEPPLADMVADAAAAADVAAATRAEPLFERLLWSADGRGGAIYVPLAADADRPRLFHLVRDTVEEVRTGLEPADRRDFRTHLLGPAAAESLLGEHVLADLAVLLPLALLVVALVLGLWFRQGSIVVVGLGEAAAVVLWSLGLLAAAGRGISLVTVVMPVILATYCVADTIHIGQRFCEKCTAGGARGAVMEAAIREILKPVAFTSLTTAAGFLAFAASPIPPLRDFGLFTAFGIVCALGTSVLVVPPALLLTGFGKAVSRHGAATALSAKLREIAEAAARAPGRTLTAAVLVSAVLGVGMSRLEIQDSWVRNFSDDSDLVQSDRWFNRGFMGSNVLNVVLTGEDAGAVYEPRFLDRVARLQTSLTASADVGGSLSLVDQLRAVGRTLEREDRLPETRGEAQEWSLLFEMAGGSQSLHAYVNDDASAVNLWLYLNRADYRKTRAAVEAVEDFTRRDGARRDGVDAWSPPRFAGDAYLGYLLVDSIARSQRGSLAIALALTLLLVGAMFGSWKEALLAVLPVSVAILWNFGFMGWCSLPLGVATSTFSAIALGIGVDFALHWIASLRLALGQGAGWQEAVGRSSATSGVAILVQGAVLLLGFGVLIFSSVPPNQRLGLLMCVNLAACLSASLVLLPAVATLVQRRFLWSPGSSMGRWPIHLRKAENG